MRGRFVDAPGKRPIIMDSTYNVKDQARSASDAIAGAVERSTNNTAGRVAQGISESNERHDAREPMNSTMRTLLLAGAGIAIVSSLAMQLSGRKQESVFVGQWAPTLISIALWYQMVKGQQLQSS